MDDPYAIALTVILSLIGGMLFFGVLTFGAYNPQRFAGIGSILATLFFALTAIILTLSSRSNKSIKISSFI